MPVICPECRQIRPPDATNPEWECPACGICYAKYGGENATLSRRERDAPVVASHGWSLGTPLKILAFVLVGWGVHTAYDRHVRTDAAQDSVVVQQEQEQAQEHRFADAMLAASGADTTMLHNLSDSLERNCARNKYGLSEQECVTRVQERADDCATRTARQYPGQIQDTSRMQIVVKAHVDCILAG